MPRLYERISEADAGFLVALADWWEARRLGDRPETPSRRRSAHPRAATSVTGGPPGTRSTGSRRTGRRSPSGGRPFGSSRSWASTKRRAATSGASCSRSTGPTWSGPSSLPSTTSLLLLVDKVNELGLRLYDGSWVRPSTCRPRSRRGRRQRTAARRSRSPPTRSSPRTSARGRSRPAGGSSGRRDGRMYGSTCRDSGRRCSEASRSRQLARGRPGGGGTPAEGSLARTRSSGRARAVVPRDLLNTPRASTLERR